jgi:hypothetical protein
MASSVPLIESWATWPLFSLKDHSAMGPLLCPRLNVGIQIKSQVAAEIARFMVESFFK